MTAATASALATIWGFPELDVVLALAAGALDIVTAQTCSTDPPPDPILTSTDIINAIDVMNPGLAIPAQIRVQQWFLHRYWWNICTCTSGPTPAPPGMSNPNTPIGIGTGAPSGQNAGPCWTITARLAIPSDGNFAHNIVAPWLPSGPGSTATITGITYPIVCVPPPGSVTASWSFESLSSTVPTQLALERISTTGTGSGQTIMADSGIAGVQAGSVALSLTTQVPYLQIQAISNPLNNSAWISDWAGTFSITCSGSPPSALVQPCCPPDPLIDIKIDQLLGLVLNLYNNQSSGSGGPTSWRDGVRHSGLAGNGLVQLLGKAIGVRAEMTTLPSGVQVNPGSPDFYWDSGFITPYAMDTPLRGNRLVFRNESFQLPAVTDAIGYTLLHGTVIDLVELLPV